MIYSIISFEDIFYNGKGVCADNSLRSSNPYDYIRAGYYLDNASLFGGDNNVDFKSNISGYRAGGNLCSACVGKRTQRDIP
ncbi:MAG: hypothetical protein NC397_03225 [Clostridium sp.]|nr:hypothetical protein [Clostridium sp.]